MNNVGKLFTIYDHQSSIHCGHKNYTSFVSVFMKGLRKLISMQIEAVEWRNLGQEGNLLVELYARCPTDPSCTDIIAAAAASERCRNRLTSSDPRVFGDGVLLPAATSSAGASTTSPLKTPSIFLYS
ncbi:stem-specific protein TSJT1-like [Iris pallida]|uniref:Stem-specific protein TSJT1-like n=1 Tax=Iris pallida TaxID=29817 RepID=A0AAX6IJW4_IRIPA|nr:stem-specific protein TSJT1-like [Iris pallida]KAJ6853077.1 stem-specific protein TSJT1-like [Iris pallida]